MTSTRFSGDTVERISCRASARKLRSVDVSCARGTPALQGQQTVFWSVEVLYGGISRRIYQPKIALLCCCLLHTELLLLSHAKQLHQRGAVINQPAGKSSPSERAAYRVVVGDTAVVEHELRAHGHVPAKDATRPRSRGMLMIRRQQPAAGAAATASDCRCCMRTTQLLLRWCGWRLHKSVLDRCASATSAPTTI